MSKFCKVEVTYVETDRFGNPIKKTISWISYGKTKGELKALTGKICKEIVDKALATQIEQFGYFIFDLSIFNPKLVKIEVIEWAITIKFDKFCLEIAKFESEAPKLLNLGCNQKAAQYRMEKEAMSLFFYP